MSETQERAMLPIPVSAAAAIAEQFGYDQVVIVARRVGDEADPHGEHVTTFGTGAHRDVAARIGHYFQGLMAWPDPVEKRAVLDVAIERERQETLEGCSPDLDNRYVEFELGKAAAAYLGHAITKDRTRDANAKRDFAPGIWPWPFSAWKPKDRRRDLVRAAALIIAEIERLDRVTAKGGA